MVQLLIGILFMCGSLGATISKITTDYGFKKNREHNRPLSIEKDVLV